MIKLKSLTATLAATALVSGIGLAYAQNSTDATNPGPGAPAATDSQYNSNNSAMSNSSTTTAPADTSSTAPSTAPSTDLSTNSSTSADTSTSPDSSMTERAPQADRN